MTREHTAEHRAAIAAARRRKLEQAASKPRRCQVCKAETKRSDLVRYRGRWTCGACITDPVDVPLTIEEFARQPGALSWAGEVG